MVALNEPGIHVHVHVRVYGVGHGMGALYLLILRSLMDEILLCTLAY